MPSSASKVGHQKLQRCLSRSWVQSRSSAKRLSLRQLSTRNAHGVITSKISMKSMTYSSGLVVQSSSACFCVAVCAAVGLNARKKKSRGSSKHRSSSNRTRLGSKIQKLRGRNSRLQGGRAALVVGHRVRVETMGHATVM